MSNHFTVVRIYLEIVQNVFLMYIKIIAKELLSTLARFERTPPKRIDGLNVRIFKSIALDHSATAPRFLLRIIVFYIEMQAGVEAPVLSPGALAS